MKNILKDFLCFDKHILSVIKYGIRFSFIFCLFSSLILSIYETVHTPNLFYVGISLFRTSLFFLVAFIIYGFIFNFANNRR